MPASSGDGVLNITASLKASLGVGRGKCSALGRGGEDKQAASLDEQLFATNKQVLLGKLEFEKAPEDSTFHLNQLRNKYASMNPQDRNPAPILKSSVFNGHIGNGKNISPNQVSKQSPESPKDGLTLPERILYDPELICNKWEMSRRPAVGLVNMGNTCFLNSVIQCLCHTPPLYNYLMSRQHTESCKLAGFCILCELERHFRRAFDSNHPNGAIKPLSILQRLKCIAKHLHWGRQEDAHEFLRYVIDCMQKCALHEHRHIPKLDPISKNTTVVHQIFGGYLRSQVLCMRCKFRSNTYDPFLDISLDIKTVPSVEKALERYVAPEVLGNENAYKCERCHMKVPIQKRFTIHQAPNILTLQLKRFEFHKYPPSKLSKPISFSEKLDIRPYMSQRNGEPVVYYLYAVLQHFGISTNSGHYLCHVRAPNGSWYNMNDSQVSPSSLQRVLNSEAYLLFYVKVSGGDKSSNKPLKQSVNGGCTSGQIKNKFLDAKNNGTDINSLIGRNSMIGPQLPSEGVLKENNKPFPNPTSIPLHGQREKIAFGIKPISSPTKEIKTETSKPRIVMHIKQGKIAFNSVANADKKSKLVNGKEGTTPSKLVPYQDDESSSEDEMDKYPLPNGTKQHSPMKKESPINRNGSEPILDQSLNATLNVPGAYKPLDQEIKKLDLSGIKKEKSFELRSPVISPTKDFRLFKETQLSSPPRLTVVTSPLPSSSKVNSTTSWSVLDQDAQASPSLASGSSNTSCNSTTDWQVFSHGEGRKPVLVPEAQCPGWTVTKKDHESKVDDLPSDKSNGDHKYSSFNFERNVAYYKRSQNVGPSSYLDVDLGKAKNPLLSKLKRSNSDSNISSLRMHNCVKSGEGNDSGFVSDDMDSASSSRKTENKSNGTGTKSSPSSESTSQTSSFVDSTDDTEATGDNSFSSSHKKHKKKKRKKHKHKSQECDEERHKKKKKKHKYRHADKDATSSDSETTPKKRKLSTDDDGDQNGTEYIWVEKTMETLQNEDGQDAHSSKEVPTQEWDHHIKQSKSNDNENTTPAKVPAGWDGVKSSSSDVLKELEKNSLNKGYGAQVNAWDGGKSHMDLEQERIRAQEQKRNWVDDYEEELDRGKAKKVKKYQDEGHKRLPFNPFQRYQNRQNKGDDLRRKGPWYSCDWNRHDYHHSHQEYNGRGNYSNNFYRSGGHRGYHHAPPGFRGRRGGGHMGYHHGNPYYGHRHQNGHRGGHHRFH